MSACVHYFQCLHEDGREHLLDPFVIELQCYHRIFATETDASSQPRDLPPSSSQAQLRGEFNPDAVGALQEFYRHKVSLQPSAYPRNNERRELPYAEAGDNEAVFDRADLYRRFLPRVVAGESGSGGQEFPAASSSQAPEELKNVQRNHGGSSGESSTGFHANAYATRRREALLLDVIRTELAAAVSDLCWTSPESPLRDAGVLPSVRRSIPHFFSRKWYVWQRSRSAASPASEVEVSTLISRVSNLLKNITKPHLSIVLDLALFSVLHVLFESACERIVGSMPPRARKSANGCGGKNSSPGAACDKSWGGLRQDISDSAGGGYKVLQKLLKKDRNFKLLYDKVLEPWSAFYESLCGSLQLHKLEFSQLLASQKIVLQWRGIGGSSSSSRASGAQSASLPVSADGEPLLLPCGQEGEDRGVGKKGTIGGVGSWTAAKAAFSKEAMAEWVEWWFSLPPRTSAQRENDAASSDEEDEEKTQDADKRESKAGLVSPTIVPKTWAPGNEWLIALFARAKANALSLDFWSQLGESLCKSRGFWAVFIGGVSLRMISTGASPLPVDQFFSIEEPDEDE